MMIQIGDMVKIGPVQDRNGWSAKFLDIVVNGKAIGKVIDTYIDESWIDVQWPDGILVAMRQEEVIKFKCVMQGVNDGSVFNAGDPIRMDM